MSGAAPLDWLARPARALRGRLRVPGDKSISHRAMMLGSLAEGVTRVRGFLEGEDTLATAAAFRAMGVRIDAAGAGERVVHGVGLAGLQAPRGPIDCGNAGTGMRLLAGVLAAQPFPSILVGDDSLSRRPMRRVLDPLARMGARIDASAGGTAPLRIAPANGGLHGIDYESPVASAQVKSCVLLAGLRADGRTRVAEPHPTRDHTERMLAGIRLAGRARRALDRRARRRAAAGLRHRGAGRFFLRRLLPGRGLDRPGLRTGARARGLEPAADRAAARVAAHGRRHRGAGAGHWPGASRSATCASGTRPCAGSRYRSSWCRT